MSKKIVAKTGTYQKDGQAKNRYTTVGVILNNDNGEYVLIDPSVSLSGVLAKQNVMALASGKNARDNVMCSIFDDSQQGGYQQPSQPNQYAQQTGAPQPRPQQPIDDLDQHIPF